MEVDIGQEVTQNPFLVVEVAFPLLQDTPDVLHVIWEPHLVREITPVTVAGDSSSESSWKRKVREGNVFPAEVL